MKVTSYNNGNNPYFQQINQNVVSPQGQPDAENTTNKTSDEVEQTNIPTQSDTLEISNDMKQMAAIQSKIESGFYDSPEVLQSVAEKILRALKING